MVSIKKITKQKILLSLISLLVAAVLLDIRHVNRNIEMLYDSRPQLFSVLEGCLSSYLMFDTTLNKKGIAECFSKGVMLYPNLRSIHKFKPEALFIVSDTTSFYQVVVSLNRRENVQGTGNYSNYLNIKQLKYWNYRFLKPRVQVFTISIEEVLSTWVHEYTIDEMGELSPIDIEKGRPGGWFYGKLEDNQDNKLIISKGLWLIEANLPIEFNLVEEGSDSCIVHGMFKEIDFDKHRLLIDPAMAYNIADTNIIQSLNTKKLSISKQR